MASSSNGDTVASRYESFMAIRSFSREEQEKLERGGYRDKVKTLVDQIEQDGSIIEYGSEDRKPIVQALGEYFKSRPDTLTNGLGLFFATPGFAKEIGIPTSPTPRLPTIWIEPQFGIIGKSSWSSFPRPLQIGISSIGEGLTGSFVDQSWSNFKLSLIDLDDTETSKNLIQSLEEFPIKCLLEFKSRHFSITSCGYDMIRGMKNIPAYGSVEVERIVVENRFSKALIIAFSGENIQSASLTLQHESEQKTKARLITFKNRINFDADETCPEVITIGYIFASLRRESSFFRQSIFEYDLIHQIFPKVNFSGVMSCSALGVNSVSQRDHLEHDSICDARYTTSIVLIQFRKGKVNRPHIDHTTVINNVSS